MDRRIFPLLQIAALVNQIEKDHVHRSIAGLIHITDVGLTLSTSSGFNFTFRNEGFYLRDPRLYWHWWEHPLTKDAFLEHFGRMRKERRIKGSSSMKPSEILCGHARQLNLHLAIPEESLPLSNGKSVHFYGNEQGDWTALLDTIIIAVGSTRYEMELKLIQRFFRPTWRVRNVPWPIIWRNEDPRTLGIYIDYVNARYTIYATTYAKQLFIPMEDKGKTRLVREALDELPPWFPVPP